MDRNYPYSGVHAQGAYSYSNSNSIKAWSEKFSDLVAKIDDVMIPVKPFLPMIGRLLIVLTFVEDSFRICSQWNEQVFYLYNYRHIPYFITVLFLGLNVITMLTCSFMMVTRRRTEIATGGLFAVVISQATTYGLLFDLRFLLRNVSVLGGLCMALAASVVRDRGFGIAGLPQLDEKDRRKYFQLVGRVLLIFLFLGYVASGKRTPMRFFVSMLSLCLCSLVTIGFKTKVSAGILVIILSVYNISANYFWAYTAKDPRRDFLKYEFFQTLSIVGGLLLVVNTGAGALSIDEKKKIY